MKKRHFISGAVFWIAAVVVGWTVLHTELTKQSSTVASLSGHVTKWLTGQKQKLTVISDETMDVAIGDPIFLADSSGNWKQVGLAVDVDGSASRLPVATQTAQIVIYDNAINIFEDGFRLEYHTTPMSLDWVVRTMIPPDRQKEIARYIAGEWKNHQIELTAKLRPILKAGVKKALKAVEDELPIILKSHQADFRSLGGKYETEILKAEVVPLVKEEILPIIEDEAVPVAEEVGRALWKRVSLWSFTWRLLYDKSPLPRRDAVKEEFQRFVEDEALPELRSRSDQFVDLTATIVKRSLENPRVKEVMKRNLKRVAEDPELHRVIWSVVREAVVENQTLRIEIESYMKDQETKAAMKLAGIRLEPAVRHIGDMIFGSRETGITPEFSRILRSQILTKDRRWFVMVPSFDTTSRSGTVPAAWAYEPMVYPMGFGGQEQSPLTPAN